MPRMVTASQWKDLSHHLEDKSVVLAGTVTQNSACTRNKSLILGLFQQVIYSHINVFPFQVGLYINIYIYMWVYLPHQSRYIKSKVDLNQGKN